jgi:mannosyltransferase OCH1-like enzyme
MIPKIIHNIWLEGYNNLPNEYKLNHNNIKKINPEWEFIVWDDEMIIKVLKKYPKIYSIYKKIKTPDYKVKSYIARYIILKEYGGLYYDIEYKCDSSFDNLFLNNDNDVKNDHDNYYGNNNTDTKDNNVIYVSAGKSNLLDIIMPFQKTQYSSSFVAINKEHPIWRSVIEKLIFSTTNNQINTALNVSLQETNKYKIIILNKVNDNYQCINKDTVCYLPEKTSWNFLRKIVNYIECYYKQIFLFMLSIVIIVFVEYIYLRNAAHYGVTNFIPGMPGTNQQPSQIVNKSPKKKNSNKK